MGPRLGPWRDGEAGAHSSPSSQEAEPVTRYRAFWLHCLVSPGLSLGIILAHKT